MSKSYKDPLSTLHAVRPFMTLAPSHAWVTVLDWADEKAVVYFAKTVVERQLLASERDLEWLDELSNAVIDDVNFLLHEAEERCEPTDGRPT